MNSPLRPCSVCMSVPEFVSLPTHTHAGMCFVSVPPSVLSPSVCVSVSSPNSLPPRACGPRGGNGRSCWPLSDSLLLSNIVSPRRVTAPAALGPSITRCRPVRDAAADPVVSTGLASFYLFIFLRSLHFHLIHRAWYRSQTFFFSFSFSWLNLHYEEERVWKVQSIFCALTCFFASVAFVDKWDWYQCLSMHCTQQTVYGWTQLDQ